MFICLCTHKIRLGDGDSYFICTLQEIIVRKVDKASDQTTDQTGFSLKNRMSA